MNNILDLSKEENQRFIASVLCALCENSPITLSLANIDKYFSKGIPLQYTMVYNSDAVRDGVITFSLRNDV